MLDSWRRRPFCLDFEAEGLEALDARIIDSDVAICPHRLEPSTSPLGR